MQTKNLIKNSDLCVPVCSCMDMFCLYVRMSVFVCVCLPVLLMQYHYNIFESLLGDALQMYCIAVVSFDLSTHCDILYIFILLSFCISIY